MRKGQQHTPAARMRIGAAQSGKTLSQEHREALSASRRGKSFRHSPATRARMSVAQLLRRERERASQNAPDEKPAE